MMCRQTHSLVFLSLLCGFLTFPLPLSLLFSLFLTPPSFNSAIFSCSSLLSRCLRIPLCCICILSEGLHFTEHVCYRWLPGSPHVSHSQGDKRCVWDRNGTRHHLLPHSIFHILPWEFPYSLWWGISSRNHCSDTSDYCQGGYAWSRVGCTVHPLAV